MLLLENPSKGKSITAMVLGIVALVFCWIYIWNAVSIVLSIVAIILAVSARKQSGDTKNGMATAGLICGIIALVLSSIFFVSCTLCIALSGSTIDELNKIISSAAIAGY